MSTCSSFDWKSAYNKFRNKIDNMLHNYPKLPKWLPRVGQDQFPLQIGSGVSVKDYNTFLDRYGKIGYKFRWDRKNVYIIEMTKLDRQVVASYLFKCFHEPNNRVKRGPIRGLLGQPFHYNPLNHGEKMAPDVAVYPSSTSVPRPIPRSTSRSTAPHPGPPSTDIDGFSHARIMVEVASAQNINSWNTRCETWLQEQYVRCVLGIKLDFIRNHKGRVERSMLARLWTRQTPAPAGFVAVTNPNLSGVSVKTWEFGTLLYGTTTATTCTSPGLAEYQVDIPIAEVFWNPAINTSATGVKTVNTANYGINDIVVPNAITVPNFVIDLYELQQEVLDVVSNIF